MVNCKPSIHANFSKIIGSFPDNSYDSTGFYAKVIKDLDIAAPQDGFRYKKRFHSSGYRSVYPED